MNLELMSRLNRWHAAIPVILLFGGGWVWVSRPSTDASAFDIPRPALFHPAPDFTLPHFGADPAADDLFTLSAARGTPVVLNFWATWCGPCRREFPALQTAAARQSLCAAENETAQADGGKTTALGAPSCFLVVAVNQGERAAAVEHFLAEIGGDAGRRAGASKLAIVLDGSQEVGRRYNVQGLPLTFFIDAEGIIRSVWSGEMNSVILAENIADLVK